MTAIVSSIKEAETPLFKVSSVGSNSTAKVQQCASFVFESIATTVSAACTKARQTISLLKNNVWTKTEVSRICLRLLATYALTGGILMTSSAPQAIAAASSLFLIAAGLVKHSYSLIDYENPEELAKARESALRLSFLTTLNTHGWENLVFYQILSPEAFATSCKEHMNHLSFSEIVSFHQKLKEHYTAFPVLEYLNKIPHPALWKEKFMQETQEKTPVQLLAAYPIEKLKTLNLLPEEEICRLAEISSLLDSVKQTEKSRKTTLSSNLQALQSSVSRTLTKKQNELETKLTFLTRWIEMETPPSLQTMAEIFSEEEMESIRSEASGLEAKLNQLHSQLEALNAYKAG